MSGLSKVNLFQCGLENTIFLTPEKVSEPLTLAIEIISIFLLVYNLLGDCRVCAQFSPGRFIPVFRFGMASACLNKATSERQNEKKTKTHMYGR